jgi:hypothetical protein
MQMGIVEITIDTSKLVWMKNALGSKESMKCTYESRTDEGMVLATVFVMGEKIKAEYLGINKEGQRAQKYMVVDDKNIYAWTGDDTPGVVMPKTTTTRAILTDSTGKSKYKCEKWGGDEKVFLPPTGVKFVDNKLMQDPECGPCEYLIGVQQDTCRKMAQCENKK